MQKDVECILVTEHQYTNEAIATLLISRGEINGSDIVFRDYRGQVQNGWIVNCEVFKSFCENSKRDENLRFVPYKKDGQGKYRPVKNFS
jgi:hypothetical protein